MLKCSLIFEQLIFVFQKLIKLIYLISSAFNF